MRPNLKRVRAGVAAVAITASTALVLTPTAAYAAGTLAGPATVKTAGGGADLNSGDSGTAFRLSLPSGASCPGDSANDGYRWQTYMVPASVDPSTLTFDANGPTPQGTGASFRQPLYDSAFNPVVNQQTANATTPPGPGPIINIPDTSYAVYAPADIPAGVYNIGIACTLGPASTTQMKDYWNVQKTFTTSTASATNPAGVDWAVGALVAPNAPTLNSLTSGDGILAANFTPAATGGTATTYTASATPTAGGTAVTATGGSSPVTISGLTNGTSYDVVVTATNAQGTSPASNQLTGTPAVPPGPPVTNLQAVPGTGSVTLNWTAPTAAPNSYTIAWTPVTGTGTMSITAPAATATVTGLTAGTVYTFTVTPQYTAGPGTPATATATPLSAQTLTQTITVTRPAGAIVLTQVCGRNGAIPADTSGTPGFPSGSLPAIAATAAGAGTAPTVSGGGADPKFGEYPYPTNADGTPAPNYPTNCGVSLGDAKFIRTGPGAGQFFAASGVLSQVTVVDTRDTDTGWNATGTMGAFTSGPGKTFSGSQLGWSPVKTSDTALFTDSDGNTYDMTVNAGAVVNPNTASASGLSSGRTLGVAAAQACTGSAPTACTGGLGIAELDARLKLLIPVTARSGLYTGTLTFSVL